MTLDEIKEASKALHIGGVSKRYLVKFVDSFWFEHETTVDADCEFDAIEQVRKQFKNASHFSVSVLNVC